MERLKPPGPLSFEGNVAQTWKTWRKAFDFYLVATESDTKSDKIKTSILLTCIGDRGREIYETFEFATAGDSLKLNPVLDQFEAYCNPRSNTTINRHKFFTYRQAEGQPFNNFVTELRTLSAECAFENLRDSLIKDMIICGVSDRALRERMLREPTLDLKKAIELGLAAEQTKVHSKQLTAQIDRSVSKISHHRQKGSKQDIAGATSNDPEKARYKSQQTEMIKRCKFCAGSHSRGRCPAYGKQCNKCRHNNHYAKCCTKRVQEIEEENFNYTSDSSSATEFYIGSIEATDHNSSVSPAFEQPLKIDSVDDATSKQWSINLETVGKNICYKIDTGAQVNVLPKKHFDKLKPRPPLKTTSVKLSAYNDTSIPVAGKSIIPLVHKGVKYYVLFIVVSSDTTPIIGLNTSEKLNLIQRVSKVNRSDTFHPDQIPKEYFNCFGEVGILKTAYHIELKDDVTPVVVPPRKIPYALKDPLKKELDRMEQLGIIEKVEKSTDWVNALVLVTKPNGKLRVCLDPRPLNHAIKRHHYRLPTAEEIISQMHGAKFFTKLDASNGYWQIPVDNESSDLLTFATTFGRYKFKRMPYGIHSASEIFQLEISKIIEGIDGVANSQDDIIIWAETKEIHDARVKQVLTRIRDSGLKLNKDKCTFGARELTFLGHIISAEGVKPDPRKVEAITKMPIPTNKTELQRFMGMVNYLGKFIPRLSDETAPLRELLKKDVEFVMLKPQTKAFQRLQSLITTVPILQYYDPNLPTRLRTDSSLIGLGAMIEQSLNGEWHPIAFASRSLDKSEQNYASIERETLSVVFGCERFHEYLYGREFIVQNDHKPLKTIFSRSITSCPPRIQRFFLRLQKYSFVLEYSPGRTMKVADTLSRAYTSAGESQSEIDEAEMLHYVHSVIQTLPISDAMLQRLQSETARDTTLQKLKEYTIKGWPSKTDVDPLLTPYYQHRDDIVYNYELLLKGHRIIIPPSMRSEIKSSIHQGHQGQEKCILRARNSVFWPGINHEIIELVSQCAECLNHRNRQKREPLLPHDIPSTPWTKVACDLFTIYGKEYLLIIDYHSKYFEIAPLEKTADSSAVIRATKKIFSRHGIPKVVFSDNGPQFTAHEYKQFAKTWDFDHNTSSPHFPQSNGLVERKIQTVKRTLKKAQESGQDVHLALLTLNTTPSRDGKSPAFKLFNRNPRTPLPSIIPNKSHLIPTNHKIKQHHDRHANNLQELAPGAAVRMRIDSDTSWKETGKIIERCQQPRSYLVLNSKGNIVRRNRRHLLPTTETFKVQANYDQLPTTPNETTLAQNPKPSSTQPSSAKEKQKQSDTTITRSGRQSRPPVRYPNTDEN